MSSPAEQLNAEYWLTREQLHELLRESGDLPAAASKMLMYVATAAPLGNASTSPHPPSAGTFG